MKLSVHTPLRLRIFALFAFSLLSSGTAVHAQGAVPQSRSDGQGTAVPASKDRFDDEDLSTLSLEESNLRAEKPLIGERDERPEFTRELVQVHWRLADPIDLYVILPRAAEKPAPILYLYSYPSETDRFRDDGYCRRVTQGGFAAIGFVSALTGHRYHDRPMRQWFVSELQESLVTSVHDVQMILNYLSTRGDLNMERVGMFGVGSGGTIAVLSAGVDGRIKALDVIDPWGDWPDWLAKSARVPEAERARYLTPEFLSNVAPFDPVDWLSRLENRPVRIQHVMDDVVTPEICKKRIESAAQRSSMQVTRYESTRAMLDASSGGKLFQWVKERVGRPSQSEGTQ
jgi:hypothetical protein